MSIKNLLAMSALNISPVTVAGETFHVREPNYPQMRAFHIASQKGDERDAAVGLFEACIVNEDGTPAITKEEAVQLYEGKNSIFLPLLNAVTSHFNNEEAKKV